MGKMRRIIEEEKGKVGMMMNVQGQGRRKGMGMGVKKWMVVSEKGQSLLEEVEKHSIMRRTGLPARDLRVLDPMLSNPSSILGRDRAIVVNLEHIKAIITPKEILMINSSNPLFLHFLHDLLARLPSSNNETPHPMSNDTDTDYEAKSLSEGSPTLAQDVPEAPAPKQLPFEFRALEACLESACMCLESEARTLEEEAYPALDELTSKISTLNLERVRQIKSRLVALSGRVQKVADQLEHLLDDDNDMAEMYLTQKLDARLLDQAEASSKQAYNVEFEDHDDERCKLGKSISEKSDTTSGPADLDVEELEMLLEAYFAQINGIMQKLSSMSEYVDDTEDYINIMLDDKRNQLLQVAVVFDTLNMIVSAGIVVVGSFGMNIHIDLFDGQNSQFWATTWGTVVGCVVLFLVSVWWGKKRYLLPR
ncbi:magnesium transporter MRS2-F-like [Gastrolobium bilobum]|uniref:magnesium transporter MRS2-F-like n=1 Tax=Gastrolobium bilobum TaxID=150636 RepID=UPI002AAFA5C3|nr:magnesium transporter MRS2-F-like [Gastrolobium bilobum]